MTRLSDYALLRYLATAQGIDIDGFRLAIEDRLARSETAADVLGIDTYAVRMDGVQFVVRFGTVTTVLPKMSDGSRFRALGPRHR